MNLVLKVKMIIQKFKNLYRTTPHMRFRALLGASPKLLVRLGG
jgi:hypothetical protein